MNEKEIDMNMNDVTMEEITDQVDATIKMELNSDECDQIMCEECSVIVKNNARLVKHRRDQHEQHICIDCGKLICGRKKLIEHHRIHRKEPCPSCNILFSKKQSNYHIPKCRTQAVERKNICNFCDYHARSPHDVIVCIYVTF